MILFHAGQTRAALAAIEKALLLQPDSRQALFIKGEILLGTGQPKEARALVADPVSQALAGETIDVANSSLFRVLSGIDDPAKVAIIAERIAGWSLVPRVLCALQLGRKDEALALLEPNALGYWDTNELLWNKAFDPIRASPQFTALLQKTGLTEAHARTQAWRQAHRAEK
jgi:tetratricopeptide (TPR) repeat protein